jgi:hypothetical protein
MFNVVVVVGPRYKGPHYDKLRWSILPKKKANITTRLEEIKKSWETTGCMVMSDGWMGWEGKNPPKFYS